MSGSQSEMLENSVVGQHVTEDGMSTVTSEASYDLQLESGSVIQTDSEHNRSQGKRRLILIRNAESVSCVFSDWMKMGFVEKEYRPYDVNMPMALPKRRGAPMVFAADPPLSVMGSIVARLIGRQLRSERILALISSPALRCVETAYWVAAEMANASNFDTIVPTSIEPAIYDWVGRKQQLLPAWMRVPELEADGYVINRAYTAIDQHETCQHRETETARQYRRRLREVINTLTENRPGHGDIVLVTHAVAIDCMLRALLPNLPRTKDPGKAYPRGCVVVLEQSDENRSWKRVDVIPPLIYTGFSSRVREVEVRQDQCKEVKVG